MKKKYGFAVMLVCLLAAGLLFIFCSKGDSDDEGNSGNSGNSGTAVTDFNLSGKFSAPVYGEKPQYKFNAAEYDGTDIDWQYADNSPVGVDFDDGKGIKALVTLTAKTGYTFTGVNADTFTYTGSASVSNPAGNGAIMKVTITFNALDVPVIVSRWLDRDYLTSPYEPPAPLNDYREWTFYSNGTYIFQDLFKNIIAEEGTYTMEGTDPVAVGTKYTTTALKINSRSWTLGMFPDVKVDGTQKSTGTVVMNSGNLGLRVQGWYVHPQNGLESPKVYYDNRDGSLYGEEH
jgi:hypothetical protein